MKKILISCDPNGRFDLLLPKIIELNNKNKFDFMLLAGKVCPIASSKIFKDITDGKYSFPIKTYFIDNSDMSFVFGGAYPHGGQIVPNFFYLGNLGLKQIQGINVAFLSGSFRDSNALSKKLKLQISKEQGKKLIDQCNNKQVDILITNQWAEQYTSLQETKPVKNQIVSQICYQLSPRYHISAGGNKYLRLPPFKGRKGNPTHFINVCQIIQNIPKDKYLVAIQMNPQIPEVLPNIVENPLVKSVDWNVVQDQKTQIIIKKNSLALLKTKKPVNQQKALTKNSFIMFDGFPDQTPNSQITQFLQKWGEVKEVQVFKKLQNGKKGGIVRFVNLSDAEICLKDSGKYTMYQSRIKFEIKQQNQKYRLKDCFLCFGNQKFDNSLLVFKGNFCFVSIDKGPVSQNHFQIVPINHVSSTGQLEIQQQQQITKIKNIFQSSYITQGYTFVCIERYMNLSSQINHAILHCIPLKISEQQTLSKFKQVNHANNFGYDQLGTKTEHKSDSPYYILISINNNKFIKRIDRKDRKFQQGRQIICQIIDKPERLNWRDCQIDQGKINESLRILKKILS